MLKIIRIEEDSQAWEAGLKSGDCILSINGEDIRDRLDFELLNSEEFLELEV